jgi:hypothetical protein
MTPSYIKNSAVLEAYKSAMKERRIVEFDFESDDPDDAGDYIFINDGKTIDIPVLRNKLDQNSFVIQKQTGQRINSILSHFTDQAAHLQVGMAVDLDVLNESGEDYIFIKINEDGEEGVILATIS